MKHYHSRISTEDREDTEESSYDSPETETSSTEEDDNEYRRDYLRRTADVPTRTPETTEVESDTTTREPDAQQAEIDSANEQERQNTREIEEDEQSLDVATREVEAMEAYVNFLERAAVNGGLDANGASLYNLAIESIYDDVGQPTEDRTYLSCEAFNGIKDRQSNTFIALEDQKNKLVEWVKAIFKWIIDLVMRIISSFTGLEAQNKRLAEKFNQIKEEARSVTKSSETQSLPPEIAKFDMGTSDVGRYFRGCPNVTDGIMNLEKFYEAVMGRDGVKQYRFTEKYLDENLKAAKDISDKVIKKYDVKGGAAEVQAKYAELSQSKKAWLRKWTSMFNGVVDEMWNPYANNGVWDTTPDLKASQEAFDAYYGAAMEEFNLTISQEAPPLANLPPYEAGATTTQFIDSPLGKGYHQWPGWHKVTDNYAGVNPDAANGAVTDAVLKTNDFGGKVVGGARDLYNTGVNALSENQTFQHVSDAVGRGLDAGKDYVVGAANAAKDGYNTAVNAVTDNTTFQAGFDGLIHGLHSAKDFVVSHAESSVALMAAGMAAYKLINAKKVARVMKALDMMGVTSSTSGSRKRSLTQYKVAYYPPINKLTIPEDGVFIVVRFNFAKILGGNDISNDLMEAKRLERMFVPMNQTFKDPNDDKALSGKPLDFSHKNAKCHDALLAICDSALKILGRNFEKCLKDLETSSTIAKNKLTAFQSSIGDNVANMEGMSDILNNVKVQVAKLYAPMRQVLAYMLRAYGHAASAATQILAGIKKVSSGSAS